MNKQKKILIVDDEPEIRELICILLEKKGYEVIEAENGEVAITKVSEDKNIDLIILDIMMPKLSGTEACRIIRSFSSAPILFLTAKTKDSDKDEAYSIGGDDFLEKPFSQNDLLRKATSLIRRYNVYKGKKEEMNDNIIMLNNVKINVDTRSVYRDNEYIKMTDREYEVFLFLLMNRGISWTIEDLYKNVWKEEFLPSSANTIMVHILRLRQKIENDSSHPEIIRTIYGKGYQVD